MITGKHLIAGQWVAGDTTFSSQPAHGPAADYAQGTKVHIDAAAKAAEAAFWSYGYSTAESRAKFLNAIADEIEARGEALTAIGTAETGLPEARLNGERGRTTGQLRLFASHILDGAYLDRRHDKALPDRAPLPRPDIKMVERPVGPVGVFGASNFPLAFSTAGGDTASALAAGCPVVVKGHPAHPGTAEIVAQAIDAAIKTCGVHPGVFSLVQSNSREAGEALVTHPLIQAVGFTGSLGAGRALFDLCAARPTPIPFYGELGSINPMFLMPHALKARGAEIAKGWAGSLTMGAGQFCTNPGVVIAVKGDEAKSFSDAASAALADVNPQTMLTDGIASAYRSGRDAVAATAGVEELLAASCDGRNAAPYLYRVAGSDWLDNRVLAEEVFGPLGIVVEADDEEQMKAIALDLHGQLTCTLQMDDADLDLAKELMPILERKAGRILANGFPTGVEVCDAMVHGGPYPASTNFGATSVGTLAIRRFIRPVAYQNMPDALLPLELK
ncbi:MAG: aldehyde dehydrogenase (NADP(+)) [Hoeflea sp.]|uniref:aldehyde dehydrogenase (NADP(+)) n=1 Tax=Hoeflea sp. TaxID=1940281 RepID=UPI001D8B9DA1|nr:aldehyde dehydrogenase (NADP(+)) [Hoeflea sp.]MBU4529520.1 aldehyde dehydrogenase (NADP(+)) [Alphaproteobacteria bacterium]MBU4546639.1 aldehyde dehydrogenase (NADP(+)) [Alphaproteobacteria bacterium]MBU4550907.1 aldehyde dehydrogenase (NADP(+)) [Alphaproteobacteria bacterium]MBV1723849.1 aldehyde dehydrogenase (NADP(+)) [Hoeflea sp.]MBV1763126.1 aldehyde dehydrogenase (NADP(+)) [Hoeflea sp.]